METPLSDPRLEAFAQAIVGGEKKTQAFLSHVSPSASRKTANERGCRLAKDGKISARIQYLRQVLTAEGRALAQKAAQQAVKKMARRLLTMNDRRAIMAEIAAKPNVDDDTRMRAVMNDAKLAGELIDKQDLTSDGEALPSAMPTIEMRLPPSFLARRGAVAGES